MSTEAMAQEGTMVCAASTAQIAELVVAHMALQGAPRPAVHMYSYMGVVETCTEYHVRTAPGTTQCQRWAGVSFADGAHAVYILHQRKGW